MRRSNLPLWILLGCFVFVLLFVAVNYFVGKNTLSAGKLIGAEVLPPKPPPPPMIRNPLHGTVSIDRSVFNRHSKPSGSLESVREKWVKQYGNIPEIETYFNLVEKQGRQQMMTLDETFTLSKLLVFFHPVPANIEAHKTMEKLYERIKANPR